MPAVWITKSGASPRRAWRSPSGSLRSASMKSMRGAFAGRCRPSTMISASSRMPRQSSDESLEHMPSHEAVAARHQPDRHRPCSSHPESVAVDAALCPSQLASPTIRRAIR